MPRPKYRDRKRAAKALLMEEAAPAVFSAPTQEVLHLKCPVCGLMANIERIEGGPYETHARTQTFGGSQKSEDGKIRHRAGNMAWSEPRDLETAELSLLARKTAAAAELSLLARKTAAAAESLLR